MNGSYRVWGSNPSVLKVKEYKLRKNSVESMVSGDLATFSTPFETS